MPFVSESVVFPFRLGMESFVHLLILGPGVPDLLRTGFACVDTQERTKPAINRASDEFAIARLSCRDISHFLVCKPAFSPEERRYYVVICF